MDKNNILEEKEAIAQKLSKVGKYFIKGAKIGALSAALVMGNVMTTSCSNPSGGSEINVPSGGNGGNGGQQKPDNGNGNNQGEEQNPNGDGGTTQEEQKPVLTKGVLNDRTYGAFQFGLNAAEMEQDTVEKLAKAAKMNFKEVTTFMNNQINALKDAIKQDPGAQNTFGNELNSVTAYDVNGKFADPSIKANNDQMGPVLAAILRNMTDRDMAIDAITCYEALAMRCYLQSAGGNINNSKLSADIQDLTEALEEANLQYGDYNNIENAMNNYLQTAATNAGAKVDTFKAAFNLAIYNSGVWGLRDSRSANWIATEQRNLQYVADTIDKRTNHNIESVVISAGMYPAQQTSYSSRYSYALTPF